MLGKRHKKRVSYLYRTAQPPTLAAFRPWGNSAGAGRIRLTRCKDTIFQRNGKVFFEKNSIAAACACLSQRYQRHDSNAEGQLILKS